MPQQKPLKLRAEDAEDLAVIASLLQDAVVPVVDIALLSQENGHQQFVLIACRFCWEKSYGEPVPTENCSERVHTVLTFNGVQRVQYRHIDRDNKDSILNLLTIKHDPGVVTLFFAGDATVRIECDQIACVLQDMCAPWPTKFVPQHQVAKA